MQIDRIEIENFRCFEHFTAKFHKELTVIVGNNGCGKSTLLDAVSIAIGTFLTGFDDVGGYGISKDDALNKCYDMGSVVELQPQFQWQSKHPAHCADSKLHGNGSFIAPRGEPQL